MTIDAEPDPFKVVFLFAVCFYLLSQLYVHRIWLLQQALSYLPRDDSADDEIEDADWMDGPKKKKGGKSKGGGKKKKN